MSHKASSSDSEDYSNGLHQNTRDHDILPFLLPLSINEKTVHSIACRFSEAYRELALTSDEQFLPTPVTGLPAGSETGQFLAIDVGGTNLRVAFIKLLGEGDDKSVAGNRSDKASRAIQYAQRPRVQKVLEKAWSIGEHLKVDRQDDLFAWIGDCIAEVVGEWLLSEDRPAQTPSVLELGITFSFPMIQDDLKSAKLMSMGKGFTLTENLELGSAILKGYQRHTRNSSAGQDDSPRAKRRRLGPLPDVKITAITNDAVATLCASAYSVKSLPNSRVVAGLIVGTGVNATVPLRFEDIGEHKTIQIRQKAPDAEGSIINTECTIYGACNAIKPITTSWDKYLNDRAARPGFQPLEYMTGGRYIGELVRIIFVEYMTMKHDPPVPEKSLPAAIIHNYSLTSALLSSVVAPSLNDRELARTLRRRLPVPESSNWFWTAHAAAALRLIASAVQTRSAGLIAATCLGLLAATGELKLEPTDDQRGTHLAPAQNSLHPGSDADAWDAGPEELVIACTGGIIQGYPRFKDRTQKFIDSQVVRLGSINAGKSILLRESTDGGVIGAGVLAGMQKYRSATMQT